MEENTENFEDFSHLEYEIAADTYKHGVNIGYTVIKNFVALQAVFFAATGLGKSSAAVSLGYVKAIPIFALFSCILLGGAFKYYKKHLDNCRDRCSEIESKYEGSLFLKIAAIDKKGGWVDAEFLFYCIVLLFILVWFRVAYDVNSLSLFSFSSPSD